MKHARPIWLIILFLALFAPTEAVAGTRLTLCNESSGPLKAAILYQNSPLFPISESWKVYGWGSFAPGCSDVLKHVTTMQVFLSVLRKTSSGVRIMHFPLPRSAYRDTGKSSAEGAERFFCVTDEPFDRVLSRLDDHENCPARYYRQLFNLLVIIKDNTHYTLRLGK